MSIYTSSNIKVLGSKPLDAKYVYETLASYTADTNNKYTGQLAYIKNGYTDDGGTIDTLYFNGNKLGYIVPTDKDLDSPAYATQGDLIFDKLLIGRPVYNEGNEWIFANGTASSAVAIYKIDDYYYGIQLTGIDGDKLNIDPAGMEYKADPSNSDKHEFKLTQDMLTFTENNKVSVSIENGDINFGTASPVFTDYGITNISDMAQTISNYHNSYTMHSRMILASLTNINGIDNTEYTMPVPGECGLWIYEQIKSINGTIRSIIIDVTDAPSDAILNLKIGSQQILTNYPIGAIGTGMAIEDKIISIAQTSKLKDIITYTVTSSSSLEDTFVTVVLEGYMSNAVF